MPLTKAELLYWQRQRILQLIKDRIQFIVKRHEHIQEGLRLTMTNPPAAAPPLPAVPAVRLPIVETLLNVSNSTLHEDMKKEMRTWSNPPTAIQVLSVWDRAREGGFANYAALEALDRLYNDRAKAEIVALAAEEE